jgi:hypothetical protein
MQHVVVTESPIHGDAPWETGLNVRSEQGNGPRSSAEQSASASDRQLRHWLTKHPEDSGAVPD